MDAIDALLGSGGIGSPGDEEYMRNVASQLRGQQSMGNVMALSNLEGVGGQGRAMTRQAIGQAEMAGDRRGALQKAMENKRRYDQQAAESRRRFDARRMPAAAPAGQQPAATRIGLQPAMASPAPATQLPGSTEVPRPEGMKQLTSTGLQTGLKSLRGDLAGLEKVSLALNNLDKMIAPYAKGGAAEGEGVPGIGEFEGSPAWYGSILRSRANSFGGGQEAQDMHAAVWGIMVGLIQESGGKTQTPSEVQNVLATMNASDLETEEGLMKGISRIKDALQESKRRIAKTQHPDVLNYFNKQYGDNREQNPLYAPVKRHDFTNRYAPRPGEKAAPAGGPRNEAFAPEVMSIDDILRERGALDAAPAEEPITIGPGTEGPDTEGPITIGGMAL